MKLIIDIPEEKYNKFMYSDDVDVEELDEAFEYLTNGTPIPDNATNGDIIKTLYPRTRDFATGLEHLGVEVRIGEFPSKLTMNVDNDWWNALYQKGGKG